MYIWGESFAVLKHLYKYNVTTGVCGLYGPYFIYQTITALRNYCPAASLMTNILIHFPAY